MEAEESNSNPEKPTRTETAQPLLSTVAEKSFLAVATTFFAVLATYAFINAFPRRQSDPFTTATAEEFSAPETIASPAAAAAVKVYMYNLPVRFTYGIIAAHSAAHGVPPQKNLTSLSYPGHQHMGEWFLFLDMNRPQSDRVGSPVTRVMDPEEADLFYVPFFSSLSQLVSTARAENRSEPIYRDGETEEELMEWVEGQEYWRRKGGRDHVFTAADPKALVRVMDRVRNSVLLVVGFGRLRGDQGSLVKDVVVPYPHRLSAYEGDVGLENRPTLLFFMGARYRKEEGKIRDILFQILENEKRVIIKNGVQSTENRREASNGMHTSKFCLNPAGDTPTSCRLFDSIVSLCIPVVVSDTIELPFEDTIDYTKIAIFVDSASAVKPGYLVLMLRAITPERILNYQKEMKEVRRYFEYGVPNGAVDEIWRQVSNKLPLIELMINRDKRLVRKDSHCCCICTNQTTIRIP